ncbi:hypothetical protein [Parablautia muri]|nr:hypothetical protein [Parablautia muri]
MADLKEQEAVNEAAYQKVIVAYEKAVSEYESALEAKGIADSYLAQIRDAAARARAAADAEFAYNTRTTASGGTTGGGESGGTSGGTTDGAGGATDGGTTGGTTDGAGGTAAVVPGAPVTNIPAAAVPLAAPDMTDDGTVLSGDATTAGTRRTGAGARTTGNTVTADGEGEEDIILARNNETIGSNIIQEDEEVPLAASEELEDTEGVVDIEDGETPLAASASEQTKMSWWWWLIVLALGATGAEMYRRHRRKLEEDDTIEN